MYYARQEKFGMQKSILIAKKVSACGMACEQWKRDQVAAWLAYVVVSMTTVCPSCLAVCLAGAHCVCLSLNLLPQHASATAANHMCRQHFAAISRETWQLFTFAVFIRVCVCVCLL